jgi:hypothetical protein
MVHIIGYLCQELCRESTLYCRIAMNTKQPRAQDPGKHVLSFDFFHWLGRGTAQKAGMIRLGSQDIQMAMKHDHSRF